MSAQSGPTAGRSATTRAFVYVLMLLSMGAAVIALGAVLHNLVEIAFHYTQETNGRVSFAAANLVVALPIFVGLFLWLRRAEAGEPGGELDRGSRLMVQVTLVVAFLWGLLRLVLYVYSLLNAGTDELFAGSNITSLIANVIHTGITLALTGAVFVYWRAAPRRTPGFPRTVALTGLLTAGCVAVVVWQAVLAGPILVDKALTNRITDVVHRIGSHVHETRVLPPNLDAFKLDTTGVRYAVTGPRSYTICATFATVSADREGNSTPPVGYVNATLHPAGEVCFQGMVYGP